MPVQEAGLYSQLRVSSSAIEKQIIMPSQKKAPIIMILVRPGLYFTCMKNRTTNSILTTAMASADNRIPPAKIDVGDSRRESGTDHQCQENPYVDLQRNNVFGEFSMRPVRTMLSHR